MEPLGGAARGGGGLGVRQRRLRVEGAVGCETGSAAGRGSAWGGARGVLGGRRLAEGDEHGMDAQGGECSGVVGQQKGGAGGGGSGEWA